MTKIYNFIITMDSSGNKWMVCPDCNTEINFDIFNSQDGLWRKQFLDWHYEMECNK